MRIGIDRPHAAGPSGVSEVLYEWRILQVKPGRLPDFVERFAGDSAQMGTFRKHGISMLGAWTEEIGRWNRFSYMLEWKDEAERADKWPRFLNDGTLAAERSRTETDGPWAEHQENRYSKLTSYSPEPRITTRIQELRIYEAMPDKLGALHRRMSGYALEFFGKHGMEVVGFWVPEVGNNWTLELMLGYDSLAERERSWAAYVADPERQKARLESEREGVLVKKVDSYILKRPAYLIT